MEEKYYPIKEAAKIIDCNPQNLKFLAETKQIEVTTIGKGTGADYLISSSTIENLKLGKDIRKEGIDADNVVYVSIDDMVELTGKSKYTIREYCKKGVVRAKKLGDLYPNGAPGDKRVWMIAKDDADLIKSGKLGAYVGETRKKKKKTVKKVKETVESSKDYPIESFAEGFRVFMTMENGDHRDAFLYGFETAQKLLGKEFKHEH